MQAATWTRSCSSPGRQVLGDLLPVERGIDSRKGEARPDGIGDRSGRLPRPHPTFDDHPLQLLEQLVGPHPREQQLLGHGQQHIHDRERIELAGVDEHPVEASHRSGVEQSGVLDRSTEGVVTGPASLTLGGDLDHVLHPYAPVSAARQTPERLLRDLRPRSGLTHAEDFDCRRSTAVHAPSRAEKTASRSPADHRRGGRSARRRRPPCSTPGPREAHPRPIRYVKLRGIRDALGEDHERGQRLGTWSMIRPGR